MKKLLILFTLSFTTVFFSNASKKDQKDLKDVKDAKESVAQLLHAPASATANAAMTLYPIIDPKTDPALLKLRAEDWIHKPSDDIGGAQGINEGNILDNIRLAYAITTDDDENDIALGIPFINRGVHSKFSLQKLYDTYCKTQDEKKYLYQWILTNFTSIRCAADPDSAILWLYILHSKIKKEPELNLKDLHLLRKMVDCQVRHIDILKKVISYREREDLAGVTPIYPLSQEQAKKLGIS